MNRTLSRAASRGTSIRETLEEIIEESLDAHLLWEEVAGQFEKLFIEHALRRAGGSVLKASEIMGVHRNTLSKKIREFHIDRNEAKRGRPRAVQG